MRGAPKTSLERRRLALSLRSRATTEFGLHHDHPICRDIGRLELTWNETTFLRVQRALDGLMLERESGPRLAERVPPPDSFEGALPIAEAPTPHGKPTIVNLDVFRIVLHAVVAGLPGSGKTYLVQRILSRIVTLHPNVRILLFDPNRSYEVFCSDPRLWLSIPWADTRLNPFASPDDYPENIWRTEKVDLLCRGELMHSKYLISARVDALFEEARRAASDGTPFSTPSFLDLRDHLAYKKSRPGSKLEIYRESALNVTDGRIRTTPNVYDCAVGMEPMLTNSRVRISTEGMSPVESLEFYITNLIHYLYRNRSSAPPLSPPSLHTLVVIEEAQTLLETRPWSAIRLYQEILLRARALGIGFIFIVQDLSRVDPTVLAACSNYFLFTQSSGRDKGMARNLADLSPREADLLGEFQTGECFIRFAGHPVWPYPFIARIPSE